MGIICRLSRKDLEGNTYTEFYDPIIAKVEQLGGGIEPTPKNIPYTIGQRGGTCAWKCLLSFLQCTIDDKLKYILLKFEVKFKVLLRFYNDNIQNRDINSDSFEYKLIHAACNNLSRLIEKIEKYYDNKQVKMDQDVIDRLNYVKDVIRQISSNLFFADDKTQNLQVSKVMPLLLSENHRIHRL